MSCVSERRVVRCLAALCGLFFFLLPVTEAGSQQVRRYDYRRATGEIIGKAFQPYDKAYEIYTWMVNGIENDTTLSIHLAADCWDARMGSDKAYCDLFVQMARCVGVRADIVTGTLKTLDGEMRPHSWLFVYLDASSGILVDPFLGAGEAFRGRPSAKSDPLSKDSWFHVDPRVMITSHFPDAQHAVYQLMENPVSAEEFRAMAPVDPMFVTYGADPAMLFDSVAAGKSLPELLLEEVSMPVLAVFPASSELRCGTKYEFAMTVGDIECDIAIRNGDKIVRMTDFEVKDGLFRCSFIPVVEGDVTLSVMRERNSAAAFFPVLRYQVPAPTEAEYERVVQSDPYYARELMELGNYSPELAGMFALNTDSLLVAARSGSIDSVPLLYRQAEKIYINMDGCPLDGKLERGKRYHFRVRILPQGQVVLKRQNERKPVYFESEGDGYYSLDYMPTSTGVVYLGYLDDGYTSFARYEVL